MGFGEKAKNAKARHARYPYLTEGNYLLEVDTIQEIQVFKTKNQAVVSVFNVLESDSDDCPVGSKRSVFVDIEAYEGGFLGDVLNMIAAVLDTDVEDLSEKELDEVMEPDQPLSGQPVRCAASLRPREHKDPITVFGWSAVSDEIRENVSQLRKAAGIAA